MLTQKELEAAVRKMIANLDEVNLYFIQKIATQINWRHGLRQTMQALLSAAKRA